MPEAVDSNSILVSRIHPASLIESLNELSQAFMACKILLENAIETGCDLRTVSHGICAVLDCLIIRFDKKTLQLKKLVYSYVPPGFASETVVWPECVGVVGKKQGLSVKALRNKFIVEQMQQGLSATQISQALNIRLSTIRRMVESLHAAREF